MICDSTIPWFGHLARRICGQTVRCAAALALIVILPCVSGCDSGDSDAASSGRASGPRHGHADFSDRLAKIAAYTGPYPIQITCTTGMVADFVRNVGANHVQVFQLMREDVDPHLFHASPGDVSRMSSADVIFYSGLHLEGKMVDFFERMERKKPTFALTAQLEAAGDGRLLQIGPDLYDPHVWFDVSLWSATLSVVADVLCRFDPPHAETYRQHADAYRLSLVELDEYCRNQFAAIPESQRVLVTAHDAFHYLGQAYNVEVKAIQGVSTESEAGVREVEELVAFIVSRKIKAVFVETSVSERNIKALVEGCHRKGHTVRIGGSLFSDAMGKLGTPEGTYAGMVRHNVNTIVSALE